jgi:pseudouridine synthase
VKTASRFSDEQIEQLRLGVELRDGRTRPVRVKRLRDGPKSTFLEMTLTEGRNRQVRRMIEAAGSKVLKLVRVAIGPVQIGGLQIGKWRRLAPAEIRDIVRSARQDTGASTNLEGKNDSRQ